LVWTLKVLRVLSERLLLVNNKWLVALVLWQWVLQALMIQAQKRAKDLNLLDKK
jgi:hypothetical protein